VLTKLAVSKKWIKKVIFGPLRIPRQQARKE